MAESELDYLLRRAAEELECAEASSDTIAAQVHRQLAVLYANQIVELRHLTELEIAGQIAPPQPQTTQPQASQPSAPQPSKSQPSTSVR